MKQVLLRKDQTSIFCPTSYRTKHSTRLKVKIAEVAVACAMISIGVWIMVTMA